MAIIVASRGVGSNTTTVTTGNSGGANGNPWDTVTIGTTGALTYSTDHPMAGSSTSYKYASGGTADQNVTKWTATTITTTPQTIYFSYYINIPVLPGANMTVFSLFDGSAVLVATHQVSTSGAIRVVNPASTVFITSTGTMTAGVTYRIEGWVLSHATLGQANVSMYVADSMAPIAAPQTSAANNVLNGNAIRDCNTGTQTNETSYTIYMGGIRLSDIGPIGPYQVMEAA